MRIILAAAIVLLCLTHYAAAWGWMPSGYHCWGCYREWPRGWYGWSPGYRYYGPGAYRSFTYWGRNPYYRY